MRAGMALGTGDACVCGGWRWQCGGHDIGAVKRFLRCVIPVSRAEVKLFLNFSLGRVQDGVLTLGRIFGYFSGMKLILCAGWALVLLTTGLRAVLPEEQVAAAREKWGAEIAKLKALDKTEKHSKEAILFLGSSSVRRWETIAEDMAPYEVIRRGYGGAKYADLAVFAEELVAAHEYRAVVVYVGNDVTGAETDATPEQVAAWCRHVADVALARQPEAKVFIVGVTPTPKRWEAQPKIDQVNAALRARFFDDPRVHYVITAPSFVNGEGLPREELFVEDKLHLNAAGYKIWAERIKANLDMAEVKAAAPAGKGKKPAKAVKAAQADKPVKK